MTERMKEITKSEFLDLYESGELNEIIGPVQVNTEARFIGRTPRGAANEETGYFVVYIVL